MGEDPGADGGLAVTDDVRHWKERLMVLEQEADALRARIVELEKQRDALVTGAFTAQNVLTPEVLERAVRAYWHASMHAPPDNLRAALLAVGFIKPNSHDP